MSETKFQRKGSVIIDLRMDKSDPQRAVDYKSINKAKRKSFEIQMQEDGALGRGSVMVG